MFERSVTDCRVEVTGGIAEERFSTDGRVPSEIGRGDTVLERAETDGCLAVPVVLSESANAPLAVLALPVVLLKSEEKPVAVLDSPVLLTSA